MDYVARKGLRALPKEIRKDSLIKELCDADNSFEFTDPREITIKILKKDIKRNTPPQQNSPALLHASPTVREFGIFAAARQSSIRENQLPVIVARESNVVESGNSNIESIAYRPGDSQQDKKGKAAKRY